ncbi:MAG: SDR family NAD(P)-dependent oxidoreductase [Bryobacteraceae bacterium]
MQIDNKVVVITGASEGIGAACASVFARRGALLSLTARSQQRLEEVGGKDALVTPGDLRDEATRTSLVNGTLKRYGRIDILINNAGVGLYQPAHSADLASVRAMFDLNVFAPLDLIQRVVPHMRKAGSGAIVNVGSIGGKITLPWFTLYSATKYALGSITDGLRMELRRDGIHAMTVCPGYVKTGFQRHVLAGRPPDLTGLGRKWAITPQRCAEDIAKGLERNARTVVSPKSGWFLIALGRLFPATFDASLEKIYWEQQANR